MHLYDTSKKRLKMFDGSLSTLKSSNGEAIQTQKPSNAAATETSFSLQAFSPK